MAATLDRMSASPLALALGRDGAEILCGLLSARECVDLVAVIGTSTRGGAGSRKLLACEWCAELAHRLRQHPALAEHLPRGHVAVQCTYFVKSAALNWLVTIHQDLSIPLAARLDAPGWQGWSQKEGHWFAQPPAELLEQLVAVRLHLDDCGPEDGPLRIVPGSHRFGRLSDDQAATLRDNLGEVACTAGLGDALLLRPLTLHASSKATGHSARRVLHFVFGPPSLPHGLAWAQAL